MSELASSSSSSSDAWSALLSWLSLLVRNLLHVIGATYCSWAPTYFKPLIPSSHAHDADENISILTSTSNSTSTSSFDRLTVVLDLDETLVCAYDTSTLPDSLRSQPIHPGLNSFQIHFFSSTKQVEGKPKINHVTVFERPGLQHFLHEVSKFADLVLFTAALEGYARPLVDKIDVHDRFKLRLYRPATVST